MDGYVGNIVRSRKSIFVCFVECGCGSWDFLFLPSVDCFVSVSLDISWCVVELVYIAHPFNTGLLSLANNFDT